MSSLYLLRHGQAAWVDPDAARPLTSAGERHTRAVLDTYRARIAAPLELWVSPLLRAQQSADLVGAALAVRERRTCDWLTPDSEPAHVLAQLQQWPGEGGLMLVAHNPLLSRLLNLLLDSPPGRYPLGTSALAALELPVVAAGCAELRWLHSGH